MIRMLCQEKLHSARSSLRHMFGVCVPRNHEEAMQLDRENGNTKWRDAEIRELDEIHSFNTFESKGKGAKVPEGYKMI